MEAYEKLYYKVLQPDRTSLGLNRCAIIKYGERRWTHPLEEPTGGTGPGGLWVARKKCNARALAKYFLEKYSRKAIIRLCVIDAILWCNPNTGRTKTNRLFLLDEVV